MKALILNFRSFAGKKDNNKDKLYITFDMYDIEGKVLYNIFQDSTQISLPDGVVPTREDVEKNFPMMADLETRISQSAGQNGRPQFRFYVDKIKSWKPAELRKLV